MWTLMCTSTGLKPSRQCSCRLTHTESYTICQVQNLPRISKHLFKKNNKIPAVTQTTHAVQD